MASCLRTRLIAALLGCAVSLTLCCSCGDGEAAGAESQNPGSREPGVRESGSLATDGQAARDGQAAGDRQAALDRQASEQAAAPRPKPAAAEALELVCEECLGNFRGSFEQIAVQLRETRTARAVEVALVDAPHEGRFRFEPMTGGASLLTAESCQTWTTQDTIRPCTPAEVAHLRRLRAEVSAAFLQPVVDAVATTASWHSDDTIRFDSRFGITWNLTLDLRTLRPSALASDAFGACRVEFVELSRRPPALPRVATMSAIGAPRHLRLLGDSIQLVDRMFRTPAELEAADKEAPDLQFSAGSRPSEPQFKNPKAVSWLRIQDPGTWKLRSAACRERGQKLADAGQKNGGDPALYRDDDGAWMVIPFVPSTDGDSSEAGDEASDTQYTPSEDERILDLNDGAEALAVVMAPKDVPLDTRIEAGRALIDQHLRVHRRKACGPLRIIVNLVYEDGLKEGSRRERKVDLRLELPVVPE